MKIACFSFTEAGRKLGCQILRSSMEEKEPYSIHLFENSQVQGGIKSLMEAVWKEYHGIIFISATGIAVRMIAPYVDNKKSDPAVVVMDDLGKFSISLLSGHLGGANALTQWIADKIGSIPVITTASDNRGIEAIDLFAKANDYYMEDMRSVKDITAQMIHGKKIGFYSEMEAIIGYENLVILENLEDINEEIDGVISVTSCKFNELSVPYTILRPKNLNIGIGCRKGVEGERIIEALQNTLQTNELSEHSIKSFGTVEVKKDEAGILNAVAHFNKPLRIFTIDEISEVENQFDKSQFVKDTIGVYSVSEPCAYLLGGEILSKKSKHNGITISIAKENRNG